MLVIFLTFHSCYGAGTCDRKNIHLRCGIESDHSIVGTSKKLKSEDVHYSNSHLNPGTSKDLLEPKPTSRKRSLIKVSLKGIRKFDDYCSSEDTKDKLIVSAKKVGDQAQVLSNGVPLVGNHGNCVNGLLHKTGLNKNNDLSYRDSPPDPRNGVEYKFPDSTQKKKIKLKPSVSEVDIQCSTKSNIVSPQNLNYNSEKEGKADYLCTKSSLMRANSCLTPSMTLDEATKLKNMADNFKVT